MNRGSLASLLLTMVLGSSAAYADAPQLAEARIAIDEVRYDDAQRLLIAALEAGGNSPAGVREIYKLLGAASVAMGQNDDAQKYYRAWLSLDPKATLAAGASPKLRDPFDAAKSYVTANGPLDIATEFVSDSDVRLRVLTDPLSLARTARLRDEGSPVPIVDGGALVGGRGNVVLVLDRYGNTLVEITAAGGPPAPGPVAPNALDAPAYSRDVAGPVITPPSRSTAFYALAVPTGLLLATSIGFGAASIVYNGKVQDALDDSGAHYYDDVADDQKKVTLFWKLSAVIGGAGLVLAIPTAILYFRDKRSTMVMPFADGSSAGAAITGHW